MIDADFWRGKRVLITGNTGFKGGWLSLWLHSMGAAVEGFSLAPSTTPSLFETAGVGSRVPTQIGDITDLASVMQHFGRQQPEIVFHMAAQALVRRSYGEPVSTYMTNVMGTVHLLEAARQTPGVRVFVNVTSDKCYENREVPWGYRECDPMGGHDPYSSSKGCAELVAAAYRRSYFAGTNALRMVSLASVRAGNVIGGGDWAEDRLVPDCIRALLKNQPVVIRHPSAVRPWQHVLEPLAGYLMTAARLWRDGNSVSRAYNFGPYSYDVQPVSYLAERIISYWPNGKLDIQTDGKLHEAHLLTLDSTLAHTELGWRPKLGLDDAIRMTVEWFRAYESGSPMDSFTLGQISEYRSLFTCADARSAFRYSAHSEEVPLNAG